ncbi:MAG TPA: PGPGW domain-containing protein [Thermoleophilaceae bacterium]|nr:PGPGW domain-containing protein [Thermoleophilaceae bacterium]
MAADEDVTRAEDDTPELLVKLRERKERHKQRNIFHRAAIVVAGVVIVLAGIVMSGPGVPGPGIVTILIGLGFLALEFDRAERWMEKVIIWGDRAADRAENTTTGQRIAAGIATALVLGVFAVAAILWDIPLMPIL